MKRFIVCLFILFALGCGPLQDQTFVHEVGAKAKGVTFPLILEDGETTHENRYWLSFDATRAGDIIKVERGRISAFSELDLKGIPNYVRPINTVLLTFILTDANGIITESRRVRIEKVHGTHTLEDFSLTFKYVKYMRYTASYNAM